MTWQHVSKPFFKVLQDMAKAMDEYDAEQAKLRKQQRRADLARGSSDEVESTPNTFPDGSSSTKGAGS